MPAKQFVQSWPFLLKSLVECKDTLEEVNISDNRSINKACNELLELVQECHNIKKLNISDLKMKKKNCIMISNAIYSSIAVGWGLKELTWNYDLGVTLSTAKSFLMQLS